MKAFTIISFLLAAALVFAAGAAGGLTASGGDDPDAGKTAPAEGEKETAADAPAPAAPGVMLDQSIKGEVTFTAWTWRRDEREGGWALVSEMMVRQPSLLKSYNRLDYVLYGSARRVVKTGTVFDFSAPENGLREMVIYIAIPLPGYMRPGDIATVDLLIK